MEPVAVHQLVGVGIRFGYLVRKPVHRCSRHPVQGGWGDELLHLVYDQSHLEVKDNGHRKIKLQGGGAVLHENDFIEVAGEILQNLSPQVHCKSSCCEFARDLADESSRWVQVTAGGYQVGA